MPSINGFYMDGVSITHGSPRNHIWSYVGGVNENLANVAFNCLPM